MRQRLTNFCRQNKKRLILLAAMLLVIGANLGATAFLRARPELVEARFVPAAKWVSSGMRAVANALPFSLTETVAALLVLLIAVLLVIMIGSGLYSLARRLFGGKRPAAAAAAEGGESAGEAEESEPEEEPRGGGEFFRMLVTLSVAAAILFSYFNIAYGFVFGRPTMFELLELPRSGHTAEELYEVSLYLASQASAARALLPEESDPAAFSFDFDALRETSTEAFRRLQEREPVFEGMLAKPKAVFFSKVMSYMGISGMYAPFFSESSISVDGIAASIPFTIAHELAHGVMVGREDEANFAAFLATIAAEDDFVRYSGYYRAFMYCSNALYSADPDLYEKLIGQTDPLVLRDRAIESIHVRSYDGISTAVSEKVNDTFIKATGQEHGIDSYGRVVDLILAYYDKAGGVPAAQ